MHAKQLPREVRRAPHCYSLLRRERFHHPARLLQVTLTGPCGKAMLLPEDQPNADLILVATGTGIAPFRSFWRRLFVEATPAARAFNGFVWLLLGAVRGGERSRQRARLLARASLSGRLTALTLQPLSSTDRWAATRSCTATSSRALPRCARSGAGYGRCRQRCSTG